MLEFSVDAFVGDPNYRRYEDAVIVLRRQQYESPLERLLLSMPKDRRVVAEFYILHEDGDRSTLLIQTR